MGKKLAEKINKLLRENGDATNPKLSVVANGFYWRKAPAPPVDPPPSERAPGAAVFWSVGGPGASWSAAKATAWKACPQKQFPVCFGDASAAVLQRQLQRGSTFALVWAPSSSGGDASSIFGRCS